MSMVRRVFRLLLCTAVLVAAMPGIAYAYWVATDAEHGVQARAAVLPAGLTPKAVPAGQAGVTISITLLRSSAASGGVLLTGYRIVRYPAGGSVPAASFECLPIAPQFSCIEPEVPDGSWEYADEPVLGNWAGPPSPRSAPITVDGAGPELRLDLPAATHDRTPLIAGTAGTAAGDLPAVTVRIFDGATLLQARTVTARAGRWQFSAAGLAANESYTVQASQRDSAGNTSTISAGFVLDTIAPSISLNTVPPVVGATPTLSGGAGAVPAGQHSSADSATVNVLIYAGSTAVGTPVQALMAVRVGKSWSIVTPELAPGEYTAKANLSDAAGNISFSSPKSFTVSEQVGS